ncbi:PKD domain-containing protein [Actinotalea sp. K2]|uniref:PKD domain-containing protein n=1 Tax=Actinotalea sp. K2 TaxID=2939438 RepID=UPI0020180B3B|nr:PKD domain-containing protein [Actinotalea sp. K2]MCL3861295.1 PKD domain-containing protein [Actinotalea sp. K2]
MPVTVAADGLPTVQIDGVVWDQLIVGNTVYVGGRFTTARPAGAAPGANTVPRANMLAFSLTTGALLSSFAPSFNAQVMSISASPDGSRIYAGGDFTSVNGTTQYRVVALNPTTGAVLPGFRPAVNFKVGAVEAAGSTVYVGGSFSAVNSVERLGLAAVNASNGALLPWAPRAENGRVAALAVSPDLTKVVAAGNFTSLNGSNRPGYGIGMVDAVTGANLPFPANNVIRDAGPNSSFTTLASDASGVYGGGYHFGSGGNLEGNFKTDWNGNIIFVQDCHGDTYSVYPKGDVVYSATHHHYCNNVDGGFPQTSPWTWHHGNAFTNYPTTPLKNDQAGYTNWFGYPGPTMLYFYPAFTPGSYTGKNQGPWSVTASQDYVVFGGEFTHVNGVRQQGLVRMANREIAPNKEGPRIGGAALNPRVTSVAAGALRIAWPTSWDRDNMTLTYRLYRSGTGAPIFTEDVTAPFFSLPTRGYTDTGLPPGSTQQYRVTVTDAFGNVAGSGWTAGTVGTTGSLGAYARGVLDDGASSYWRLGELSGTTVRDWAGVSDAVAAGGVSRGATGAIAHDSDRASTFSGTTSGFASTTTAVQAPDTFSIEVWVRTTTTRGGQLVGFGNRSTGGSTWHDRHVWMDNSGRIWFGVYPGRRYTVNSQGSFNNGQWHHVVATLSKAGQRLYVDGALVAQADDVSTGRGMSGFWRIGGDNLSGWSPRPSSDYLGGALDEVAIYPTALTAAQVAAHHQRGLGSAVNSAPTASFTSAVSSLTVSVNGSGSSDVDGTIVGYAWDFGDGATGAGVTASHTYATSGTYTVRLTVTDNAGATGTTTRQVSVAGPPPANQVPVAVFSSSVSDLAVSVDGSGSSDPDGTVAGYAWDFGDGATGAGVTASHTYAAAGTYTVTLTVTDNQGATGTVAAEVTVVEPGPVTELARDGFGRVVVGDWGMADVGGAWQRSAGSAANYQVGDGVGSLRLPTPGGTVAAYLNGASSTSVDLAATVSLDKVATGGGTFVALIGRRTTTTDDYHARVRVFESGAVTISAMRSGTTLQSVLVPGLTYAANDELRIRVEVSGTSPTTIRAKVWKVGAEEPAGWQVTTTDATPALQVAGGIGVLTYLTGSTTNAPVTARWDDLIAVPAG